MLSTVSQAMTRRQAIRRLALLGASTTLLGGCVAPRDPASAAFRLTTDDLALLDELERTAFTFFRESAHPETGLVLDRKRADGEPDQRTVASIAATGFGLSVLCVADARGFAPRDEIRAQIVRTLTWLRDRMPHERGFFYHFFHWDTGERVWKCELSSVDSAILFCGALHARAHFEGDTEIRALADDLFHRAEWPWFLDGQLTLSMGWKPESGFLRARWDHYCELMMIYLIGLGSPTHPLAPETWPAWSRPEREYEGERFIWSPAPLFVHQFSHAWFNFRGRNDAGVDWFANSVGATRAHLKWSIGQQEKFPKWSRDLWGVTSSDSAHGYVGWGGPPSSGPLDGTIVPCASAGSLPFLPAECLRTLRYQRERYGATIWKRYGFVDAWNPHNGWVNPDVVGIDVGITALMAANLRDGVVWRTVSRNAAVQRGFDRAGFKPS